MARHKKIERRRELDRRRRRRRKRLKLRARGLLPESGNPAQTKAEPKPEATEQTEEKSSQVTEE